MSKFVLSTLESLKGKIEVLVTRYQKTQHKENKEREVQLALIAITMKHIQDLDLTNPDNQLRIGTISLEESELIKKQIVTGALLFVSKQIENEYVPQGYTQYIPFYSSVVTPKGSNLYKELPYAMGISESNQMDEEDEFNFLNQFRCFFEDTLEIPLRNVQLENQLSPYLSIDGINIDKIVQQLRTMTAVPNTRINEEELSKAKGSLNPIQNSGYHAINNHIEASTLRMWKTTIATPIPEGKNPKDQPNLIQTLNSLESPVEHKLVEYNLLGYRRAFEDDKEALKRIEEYEKNRSKFAKIYCEFKEELQQKCNEINLNQIKEKNGDRKGPLLYQEMHAVRSLFFSGLSNDIEQFNPQTLKPINDVKEETMLKSFNL